MSARPIRWKPWRVEYVAGHLPTHVRDGVVRADERPVLIYLSRGDEGRYCRTWHVAIWIAGRCAYQSGMATAEDKRTAMSDLVYRATQLLNQD